MKNSCKMLFFLIYKQTNSFLTKFNLGSISILNYGVLLMD